MSKIVWAIALVPPADGVIPPGVKKFAEVRFPTAGTDVDTGRVPNLSLVKTLGLNDVFSFNITANQKDAANNLVPCTVEVLALGWIGGNCPPTIATRLNDFGISNLTGLNLPFTPGAAAVCDTLHCQYTGNGLLTCLGKGVSFSMDLTAPTNALGVYLAFESVGSPTNQVLVSFADPAIATLKI